MKPNDGREKAQKAQERTRHAHILCFLCLFAANGSGHHRGCRCEFIRTAAANCANEFAPTCSGDRFGAGIDRRKKAQKAQEKTRHARILWFLCLFAANGSGHRRGCRCEFIRTAAANCANEFAPTCSGDRFGAGIDRRKKAQKAQEKTRHARILRFLRLFAANPLSRPRASRLLA
ncbi:MAG: hypothetical protein PHX38_05120 [Sulfuricella sp.]|nr:hypothetical protein [Sulfuricella sp.]